MTETATPTRACTRRSYLLGDAVSFTHTGVRVTYAATVKLSLIAGADNGWDDWKFAGEKKTLEDAIVVNPSPGYSLTLDTYNGNDFAAKKQQRRSVAVAQQSACFTTAS